MRVEFGLCKSLVERVHWSWPRCRTQRKYCGGSLHPGMNRRPGEPATPMATILNKQIYPYFRHGHAFVWSSATRRTAVLFKQRRTQSDSVILYIGGRVRVFGSGTALFGRPFVWANNLTRVVDDQQKIGQTHTLTQRKYNIYAGCVLEVTASSTQGVIYPKPMHQSMVCKITFRARIDGVLWCGQQLLLLRGLQQFDRKQTSDQLLAETGHWLNIHWYIYAQSVSMHRFWEPLAYTQYIYNTT